MGHTNTRRKSRLWRELVILAAWFVVRCCLGIATLLTGLALKLWIDDTERAE